MAGGHGGLIASFFNHLDMTAVVISARFSVGVSKQVQGFIDDAPESGSYRFDFNTGRWNLIDLDPTTKKIDLIEDGDYPNPKFNSNKVSACLRSNFKQREPESHHSYDGHLYVPELQGILLFARQSGICGDPVLGENITEYQRAQGVFFFDLQTQRYEQIYGVDPNFYKFPTTGIIKQANKRMIYVSSKKGPGITFFEPRLVRDVNGRLRMIPIGHGKSRIHEGTSFALNNRIISASRNYHLKIVSLLKSSTTTGRSLSISYPQGKKKEEGYLVSKLWGPNGLAYYEPLNSLFQWRNDGYILQIPFFLFLILKVRKRKKGI